MKRRMVIALAAALACPTLAAAQERALPRQTGFAISPFLGYAFAYSQHGTVRFTDIQGGVYRATYNRRVDGGVMPGLALEYQPGRFGFSAAAAYNRRGEETLATDFADVLPLYSPGGSMWFFRGTLTIDLREAEDDLRIAHPTARLSLGPAMVRDVPDTATGRAPRNAFAVSGAASAELPLLKGLGLRGSFEDYVAFLPLADVGVQLGENVSGQFGQPFAADLRGGVAHLFVVRAALSYHF